MSPHTVHALPILSRNATQHCPCTSYSVYNCHPTLSTHFLFCLQMSPHTVHALPILSTNVTPHCPRTSYSVYKCHLTLSTHLLFCLQMSIYPFRKIPAVYKSTSSPSAIIVLTSTIVKTNYSVNLKTLLQCLGPLGWLH